jgi:hypothetical protein
LDHAVGADQPLVRFCLFLQLLDDVIVDVADG